MLLKSTVKYIQSLQDKKERDISGCFVAEGPKLVNELLESGIFECEQLLATAIWFQTIATSTNSKLPKNTQIIDEIDLKKISGLKTPNQVVALFRKKELTEINEISGLVLLLDDVQDPGNLGAIIRSADWFGISHIICSPKSADCYNPKVVQSTMASLGRVDVHYADLVSFIKKFKNIPVYGADLEGEYPSVLKKTTDAMLIMGNESKGISPEIIALCSDKIFIPRVGKAESLNVAMATSIILYEYASRD